MPSQSIRPSQFITTYGPGSILEGPDGPRIVLSLDHSDVFGTQPVDDYAIDEARLASLVPNGAQIVRLPTNADRQVKDSDYIYKTAPFPNWSLCVAHNILYRYRHGEVRTGCPQCAPCADAHAARLRSRREAIRFVMACPAGHLDDVDWPRIVSHTASGCNPSYLHWEGGGGALSNITIRCPVCRGTVNLGRAYNQDWLCSGNLPERRDREHGCQRHARITQRGAANLYVSEIISVITIPRLDTDLHHALASAQIKPMLQLMQNMGVLSNGQQLRTSLLQVSQTQGTVPVHVMSVIARYSDDALLNTAIDVLQETLPTTEADARLAEFGQLQKAATHGHPTTPAALGEPPQFEVIRANVRHIPGPGGHSLRITPVSRLRVVMVQRGYRRLIEDNTELRESIYVKGQNRWYPGVKLHGEGLFIDLTPEDPTQVGAHQHFELSDEDSSAWLASCANEADIDAKWRKHPVFVWWHTLAHRLVLALAVDSGYSSASVRERVYLRVDDATGSATGGVLLYTAQPGGDGTLGGLIALVPRFERVLAGALRTVDACSNDPLCNEERFQVGRSNGAACYACSFVSETSCEYRNTGLDRNVLRRNMP